MRAIFSRLRMPLVFKLTAIYAALIAAAIVLTGAALYYCALWYSGDKAHQALETSRLELTEYFASNSVVDSRLFSARILQPGVFMLLADSHSKTLLAGNADGLAPLPKKRKQVLERDKGSSSRAVFAYHTNKDFEMDKFTIRTNQELLDVTLVYSLAAERALLKALAAAFIGIVALALIVALLISYWLSSRILAPIKRLTHATSIVTVDNLDEQVNVGGISDELQELARNFNNMITRLKCGVDSEKQFVSDASHELRTPLTVIAGYADLLLRWGKTEPKTLEEGLQAIKSETVRMQTLVDKLLELAKTGAVTAKKQLLDFGQLLDKIVAEYRQQDEQHHYILELRDELQLRGDAALLEQLVRTILDNSCKYTPHSGTVIIRAAKFASAVRMSINDNGCGIASDALPHIFKRFYRADKARNSESGGFGIGLALAKRIVELHEGSIVVTSVVGSGTSVEVTLPLGV